MRSSGLPPCLRAALHSALCTEPPALSRVRHCHIPSCQPAHTPQVHMGTDVLATEMPPQQQGVGGCSAPPASLLVFFYSTGSGAVAVPMLEPGWGEAGIRLSASCLSHLFPDWGGQTSRERS